MSTEDFLIEKEKYRGYTIEIYPDEFAPEPRDDDNLGVLVCWHRRFDLGDVEEGWRFKRYSKGSDMGEDILTYYFRAFRDTLAEEYKSFNPSSPHYSRYVCSAEGDEELTDAGEKLVRKWVENNIIELPVYAYQHGDISLNTRGFHCPWDSGRVGFIYTYKEKAEYLGIDFSDTEKIEGILISEVREYDDFLKGACLYYIPETGDSCGGFYDIDSLMGEAQNSIERHMSEPEYTFKVIIKGKGGDPEAAWDCAVRNLGSNIVAKDLI